jgi:ketosteroid isomerase-like protein
MPMGEIDDRTVAGLKATLARAFEQGGTYLAVVRRQSDGAWRWAIDMWNSDAGES